jgi:four helix bundle protein
MVDSWKDLEVYRAAFDLQQRIFRLTMSWPKGEKYSLIDQIRRSSRSIGANIAEAWAKRRYPNHFLSKLTDSNGELQETLHWLRTAADCGYIQREVALELSELTTLLGKQLGAMMNKHKSFCFEN